MPVTFRPFQKHDYAALSLVDGGILAHDTGLGKSLAAYTVPLLWLGFEKTITSTGARTVRPKGRVLIVAPGDLHDNLAAEGRKFYGVTPARIDSQPTLAYFLAANDGRLPDGYYLTSYTQLTTNGVVKLPDLSKPEWSGDQGARALLGHLALREDGPAGAPTVANFFQDRGRVFRLPYDLLKIRPGDTRADLDASYRQLHARAGQMPDAEQARLERERLAAAYEILSNLVGAVRAPDYSDLSEAQHTWIIRAFLQRKLEEYAAHNGDFAEYPVEPSRNYPAGRPIFRDELRKDQPVPGPTRRIKCVYSPSLADLCWDKFDCVVVDEGVKMKGAGTAVGRGLRQMAPRYRLILTATPIKNRLPDIFWLLWWAVGAHAGPTPRFPYSSDPAEQESFTRQFMLEEFNRTKYDNSNSRAKSKFVKHRPEICSIHLLWKLLGPALLRRKKEDTGEKLVRKHRKVCRVPMGLHQYATYKYHLEASYLDRNFMPAPGAKLQALRVASAAPHSALLEAQPGGEHRKCCERPSFAEGSRLCAHCGRPRLCHRSDFPYTPKIALTLDIIREILERHEQVAVFSAFNDPSDTLACYLSQAKVPFFLLDGRASQAARGRHSRAFNEGEDGPSGPRTPVALAGVDSMAEGHNWDRVNNIILISYSWSADKFVQALARIYRLTSRRDINIYVVVCDKSADRVLEENINQKTNASALAIDGALLNETAEEMSIRQLLDAAIADFAPDKADEFAGLPNEEILERDWPALRQKLARAYESWIGRRLTASDVSIRNRILEPNVPALNLFAVSLLPPQRRTVLPAPTHNLQRLAASKPVNICASADSHSVENTTAIHPLSATASSCPRSIWVSMKAIGRGRTLTTHSHLCL